jgi:putative ABC transport system permease protein
MHTDSVIQDLRIGLRVLVKEKAFCALAVVVLALGICGVTTMFAVVNGVMLRGLSFPTADRLVSVNFIDPTTTTLFGSNGQISTPDYEEFKPVQQSFERLSAYLNGSTVNVTIAGQAKRYTGVYATEDFLRCLGVTPFLGRDFSAADNTPGAEKVALIGYSLWQRDFGGRPDAVGANVRINGKPATIIGVMPKGFAFPTNEEVWIPLYSEYPPKERTDPTTVPPSLLGVLKPGVSIDQATAEMTTIARRFAKAYPTTNKAFNTGQVQPLIVAFTGAAIRGTLWTMLAFCGGVLLIACVNVMNMQFARATLRAKELAVRSSLGATRARLIRQMLTESLLLASIGAFAGIALAYGAIEWLSAAVHNLDNPPPSWIVFDVDPRALAATVFATGLAAIVSGLLPAWMSSRANAAGVLRDGGRGNTSRSISFISRALVVFQIVVTCVLLIGALLQVRSIVKQGRIDFGYDTSGVLSARMGLMDGDYPTQQARKVFYDHLLTRLEAVPEFESVAFTTRFRMVFSGNGPIEIDGHKYTGDRSRPLTNFEQVTGGFFATLGQRLLEGRTFTDQDLDARQPVAVVNAAFVEKHYGHESALGRRFRTSAADGSQAGPWRTIVGVVSTVRMLGPFNNPGVDDSGFYVPYYASPFGPLQTDPAVSQFATVVVRPRAGQRVDALAAVLRREVALADPNLPLYFIGTPASQIDTFVAQNRIIAAMFSIFGVVAIVLASVGIYGVMSFSVNQKRSEFGLRMALGADGARILTGVLRTGASQVTLGLLGGLGLAYVMAALMADGIQSTLFGVTGHDPSTFLIVGAVVAGVSLLAILVPARRAMRVDPIVALRAD